MKWLNNLISGIVKESVAGLRIRTTPDLDTRDVSIRESLANAELDLEDSGWHKFATEGSTVFSRGGLLRIVELSRLMYLLNPLIKQAVNLQARYVFGQGVMVKGRDQNVNKVVQDFWVRNRRVFTGQAKLVAQERTLSNDGNLFLIYLTDPDFGITDLRKLPMDQVTDIITDPQDRDTVQFYLREWTARTTIGDPGQIQKRLYPDISYSPAERIPAVDGTEVLWDQPIHHIKAGGLDSMLYGVPEAHAALRWAMAYTHQLEDWAAIVRSLRRFAWEAKKKGGGSLTAMKSRMESGLTTGGSSETNPAPVAGSIFASSENLGMSPIKTAGTAVGPEDAKILRHMVAANFGVSDPHISMDVQQGALATAKDLNQPMHLKYIERQNQWKDEFALMFSYVVAKAATSPGNPLSGKGEVIPQGDTLQVVMTGLDTTVDVSFPPIIEPDTDKLITAVIKAATLDGKEPNTAIIDLPTLKRLVFKVLAGNGFRMDEDDEPNELVSAVVEGAVERLRKIEEECTNATQTGR